MRATLSTSSPALGRWVLAPNLQSTKGTPKRAEEGSCAQCSPKVPGHVPKRQLELVSTFPQALQGVFQSSLEWEPPFYLGGAKVKFRDLDGLARSSSAIGEACRVRARGTWPPGKGRPTTCRFPCNSTALLGPLQTAAASGLCPAASETSLRDSEVRGEEDLRSEIQSFLSFWCLTAGDLGPSMVLGEAVH